MILTDVSFTVLWFAIKRVFIWVSLVVLTVFVHEWGHILAYRRFTGKDINVKLEIEKVGWKNGFRKWHFIVGNQKDINNLTSRQLRLASLSGIVLGLVPYLLFGWNLFWYEAILFIIGYSIGCGNDIKNVIGDD